MHTPRPSRPRPSPYITPAGEQALRAELHHLWRVKRPQVTQAVAEAAALGDRSENAERWKEPLISYYYYLTY